jgi:hypothetical protein
MYQSFLSDSNLNFLDRFSKSTQVSKFETNPSFWKGLFPVEGRMDGQTDWQTGKHDEFVAFRNFTKASKNSTHVEIYYIRT